MNSIRFFLVLALFGFDASAATELLPGVKHFDGPEKLTGKLVFLADTNFSSAPTQMSAAIWEFDLQRKQLRKVTAAPGSFLFIPSQDGKMFCVVYQSAPYSPTTATNVFVYSERTHTNRVVHLEKKPDATVIVGHHVFFQIEEGRDKRILDYDFDRSVLQRIQLAGASQWRYQDYDKIHAPIGQHNVLHFYYNGFGKRLADGRDYPEGYYSLDVLTGDVQWFAKLLDDEDDNHTYKTFESRYIFFEGRNAPIHGNTLVSSSWDHLKTEFNDPKGKKTKVLKSFSKLSTLTGVYWLDQLSPCRKFALVRYAEPTGPNRSDGGGWANTYYIVDIQSGKTRVLLKETVASKTSGFMSQVWWISDVK